jgi:dipeptidyl aminopeptidase/acylaminoacyl peptidase
MSPELLWKLGRVSAIGLSKDKNFIIYRVGTPDIANDKIPGKTYRIPVNGGPAEELTSAEGLTPNKNLSPDGRYLIINRDIKINKVSGADFYPDLNKSNVRVYNDLMYRHWDTWADGTFSHLFYAPVNRPEDAKDLMPGERWDTPLKPFGGAEDYTWSPDSKQIVYACKKKWGREYAVSTNTDLYAFDLATGQTRNLTAGMKGYDLQPAFAPDGSLAWLSMKRDGYEADKQDIVALKNGRKINLTAFRDDLHVSSFAWSDDGKSIFFIAPVDGAEQLFELKYTGISSTKPPIRQISSGDHDVTGIIGQHNNQLLITRTDMNHAAEIFSIDITTGNMKQLTHTNDSLYAGIGLSRTEKRYVKTTDGKKMLVWVIYPPDFNPAKKYPTLLYCQGGPQSPLTQFYSFRWNFQLMAANGYIIVAPNRRGMPGHGAKWNEQISRDWGGQAMQDYLAAIDDISKENYVDKNRRGAVGASYGGYSVYYLAGIHQNRFKTFIAHDGVFDLKSMYGTTEELWFVNWDLGGPYWDKKNAAAQKSYEKFNPSNLVGNWHTPILIFQGGRDYRVPPGQGLQAFQAAQLRGIKSRLVYLPDENHWVLKPQNALVWQREFYKWLKETL